MGPVPSGLATLFASGTLTDRADIELLELWTSRRDRVALEVLVQRHAALVMNVCRSLVTDPNDADDAFQATFLVLARKASSIRAGDSLVSWLCRVAYRITVRAGTGSTRRRSLSVDTRSKTGNSRRPSRPTGRGWTRSPFFSRTWTGFPTAIGYPSSSAIWRGSRRRRRRNGWAVPWARSGRVFPEREHGCGHVWCGAASRWPRVRSRPVSSIR
jgi:hypothetical protein